MQVGRRISENRSTTILVVLVLLSFISLASETRAAILGEYVRSAAWVVAYPFLTTFRAIQYAADYSVGLVVDYNQARDENSRLTRDVGLLVTRAADRAELREENLRLRNMLAFQRAEPRLTLEPAKVMFNSPDGTLIIDRGSAHGVRELMGVITKDGVVGVVAKAELFTSSVFTLKHPQCNISAIIQGTRIAGVIQGSGSHLGKICSLVYVDMKDEINIGDKVITNSGSLFPRGYPIGTIVDREEGSLLKAAYIEPAADPWRVEEVFVVVKALPAPEELAALNDSPVAAVSVAPDMPDMRSEQEKYAP